MYTMRFPGCGLITVVALFAFISTTPAATSDPLSTVYEPYTVLLDKYLIEQILPDGGLVSAFGYRNAYDDPETSRLIDAQKKRLAQFDVDRLTDKYEVISFWLNAYNFFMLAHILENPKKGDNWIQSVRDYGSWINPYRVFRRDLFNVGGTRYSLSQIENEILLGDEFKAKGWKEARVHFAVNCASVGCPPLRTEIYRSDTVDGVMSRNTQKALQTSRHMHISDDTLYLSQLFQWYEDDYIEEAGSIREFLKRYTDPDLYDRIDASKRIRYINYDWALNEPRNFPEFNSPVTGE